jgi:uncharacterized membrane protein
VKTLDHCRIRAPIADVFSAACDVEAWPRLLPHYRRVAVLERHPDDGSIVEMAAWRPFGPARWPVWWVSNMRSDSVARTISYRHIKGVTAGMDVIWRLVEDGAATGVSIEHWWSGPRWPVIGPAAADWLIGPVFVHGIASRTLAGLAKVLESGASRDAEIIYQRP